MTSPHDPLQRLRPGTVTPLPAPDGAHEAVLRRAARRRVRTASIAATAAAVVALAVAVPLVVVGSTHQEVAGPAPSAAAVPAPATSGPATPDATILVPAPLPPTAASTSTPRPTTGPVPPGFAPGSVTFVSTQDGWTLGQAPCARQPCTSVARTSDGGSTWVGTPAPLAGPVHGTAGVDQIRFGSATDGWAFGGELWSTHDGTTWRAVPLDAGSAALSLAANSTRVVVGVGGGCATSGACQQTTLQTAGSSGDDLVPLPGASTLPGNAQVTLSGSTVWALSVAGGVTSLVRGAADGSSPMVPLSTQCSQNTAVAELAASSSTDLTLACTTTGSPDVQVFASADAGGSWTRRGSTALSGTLTSVAATRSGAVLVSDSVGGLQLSTDGGATFRTTLAGTGFRFVGFTSDSQAVALPATPVVGDLRITHDGGSTWADLTIR